MPQALSPLPDTFPQHLYAKPDKIKAVQQQLKYGYIRHRWASLSLHRVPSLQGRWRMGLHRNLPTPHPASERCLVKQVTRLTQKLSAHQNIQIIQAAGAQGAPQGKEPGSFTVHIMPSAWLRLQESSCISVNMLAEAERKNARTKTNQEKCRSGRSKTTEHLC